jgi:hypothetical protein
MTMYYMPTQEDHKRARQEYIDRVPFPSRCMHSVPLKKLCMKCDIDSDLEQEGFSPNDYENPAFFNALQEG